MKAEHFRICSDAYRLAVDWVLPRLTGQSWRQAPKD